MKRTAAFEIKVYVATEESQKQTWQRIPTGNVCFSFNPKINARTRQETFLDRKRERRTRW